MSANDLPGDRHHHRRAGRDQLLRVQDSASVTLTGNDSDTMTGGSGSHDDDSDIYFQITKTCSTAATEAVNYSLSFHL